ncbi:tol-pal system-associated acyl-CoA thioesterase [Pseudomonadota bacterium]
MTVAFSIPVRVYYEDTDAAGVVYYANYLRFMERARTEWLRFIGVEIDELAIHQDTIFAVRSISMEYRSPARLNDLLEVNLTLKRCNRASLVVAQNIERKEQLLCEGQAKLVCLHASSFRPRSIPESVLSEINTWKIP